MSRNARGGTRWKVLEIHLNLRFHGNEAPMRHLVVNSPKRGNSTDNSTQKYQMLSTNIPTSASILVDCRTGILAKLPLDAVRSTESPEPSPWATGELCSYATRRPQYTLDLVSPVCKNWSAYIASFQLSHAHPMLSNHGWLQSYVPFSVSERSRGLSGHFEISHWSKFRKNWIVRESSRFSNIGGHAPPPVPKNHVQHSQFLLGSQPC